MSVLWVLAGCGVSEVEPETSFWEATVEPVGPDPEVSGSATGLSQPDLSQVSVTLRGADPDSRLRWHVREGDCSQDGDAVASPGGFPILEVGAEGSATGTGTFGTRLRTSQRYAVEIFLDSANEDLRLACGTLISDS